MSHVARNKALRGFPSNQLFHCANCEDPDQTVHSVASDLGVHCLSITLSGLRTKIGLAICRRQV